MTNIKPGLVETNFSVVRFRGDKAAADNVYKGIRPLTGDDIAEVVYFAAAVPEHIQVAEVLVMPANQATGQSSAESKCFSVLLPGLPGPGGKTGFSDIKKRELLECNLKD